MAASAVLGRRRPLFALAAAAFVLGALSVAMLTVAPFEVIIAIAIAAVIVITTFREPRVGLIAFALIATILPFAVLPVRVLFAFSFVDLALTATLLAWLFRTLHRRQPLFPTYVGPLVFLFVGVAVLSFVLGAGSSPVDGETTRLFLKLVNSILLFFSAAQLITSVAALQDVTRGLLIGGFVAAGFALALHALPSDTAVSVLSSLEVLGYPSGPGVLRPIAETTTLRATGTAIDPNVLGGMLMVIVSLATAQALSASPVLPRPLVFGGVALSLLALGFTYSRGAWLGAAAALAFLATVRERRLWVAIALAVALLAVLPAGQAVIERLASGFAARDPAAALRISEYQNALEIVRRYPFFGIGFGQPPTIDLTVGVSSLYLTVAEQTGLVGLGLWLAIVGTALLRSSRARAVPHPAGPGLLAGYQAAIIAALVAGLFDHYFVNLRFPHMVALFWLLLAMLVVSARTANEA